jgi:hypothetical protein
MEKELKRTAIVNCLRVAVTGHRDWSKPSQERLKLFSAIEKFFSVLEMAEIPSERVIMMHGCARGIDLWFGQYAYINDIQLHLYLPIPYELQIKLGGFRHIDKVSLKEQMQYSSKVKVVSEKYHRKCYTDRNKALVNNCDILLTYFTRQRSGSGHAMRYAEWAHRKVVDLMKFEEKAWLEPSIHDIKLLID